MFYIQNCWTNIEQTAAALHQRSGCSRGMHFQIFRRHCTLTRNCLSWYIAIESMLWFLLFVLWWNVSIWIVCKAVFSRSQLLRVHCLKLRLWRVSIMNLSSKPHSLKTWTYNWKLQRIGCSATGLCVCVCVVYIYDLFEFEHCNKVA